MFIDYHVHLDKTEWSMESIEKMARKAEMNGVDRLGIVIHTKIIKGFEPLYHHILSDGEDHKKLTFNKGLDQYINLLQIAKDRGYPVDIGLEVCYSPEGEAFLKQELKKYPFDFIIGSVHMIGNMHYKTAVEKYRDANMVGRMYYVLVLNAVESKLFNIIGHMEIARREGIPGLNKYPDLLDRICKALVDNNCTVEINTKWLIRHGFLVPDRETLFYMGCNGVRLVFGSDAHHCERIGYGKDIASAAIKEAGYDGFSWL